MLYFRAGLWYEFYGIRVLAPISGMCVTGIRSHNPQLVMLNNAALLLLIKPPPQKRGLYAIVIPFCLSVRSFACPSVARNAYLSGSGLPGPC